MPQKHFSPVWHKTIKELDNPLLRKNNPLFKERKKKKKETSIFLMPEGVEFKSKIKLIDKNKTNVSQ